MAFLDEVFDINDLPDNNTGSYDPLPPGWYSATIKSVEVRQTKAQTGKYLAIRYDITGPTHQGRVIFGNINFQNPNPKAEEIGRGQLKDIMKCTGIDRVTDTDQLIGGSLMIKLAIRKSDEYGDNNDVKAFKPVDGATPMAATSKPAAAATKAAPPWARK
jgi:hypothetical protein